MSDLTRIKSVSCNKAHLLLFSQCESSIPKHLRMGKKKKKVGGLRGSITEFTPATKKRLRLVAARSMHPLLNPAEGMASSVLTLTMPSDDVYRPEWLDLKWVNETLELWWQRVLYASGDLSDRCWFQWIAELQRRGAWHIHGLMTWPDPQEEGENLKVAWDRRKAWNDRAWSQCVFRSKSVDPRHLTSACQMVPVRTPEFLTSYLSKAGTKVLDSKLVGEATKTLQRSSKNLDQVPEIKMGRFWGIKGRKAWNAVASPIEVVEEDLRLVDLYEMAIYQIWKAWFVHRNMEEPKYFPKWVMGTHLRVVCDFVDWMVKNDEVLSGRALPQIFPELWAGFNPGVAWQDFVGKVGSELMGSASA